MERGLKALLSPNEEVSFRHYEGGAFAGPRRVAYLIHLCLVDENEGRLKLSDLGRERYRGLPNGVAGSDVEDETGAVLRCHLLRARDR